jgi:hypothetical protein
MAKKSKNKKRRAERPVEVAVAEKIAVVEEPVKPARKPRAARPAKPAPRTGANGTNSRLRPDVTAKLMADLRIEAESIEAFELKKAAARKRRDSLIVRIAERGVSEREIGRAAKMSGPRVNQIYHGTGNGPANNSDD